MKSAIFLIAVVALAMPAFSPSAMANVSPALYPRTQVSDARPLMLAAIQASDGEAHGILVGDIADAITQRFAAKSPIFIDVVTARRYQQPGCSRLKVTFWQDGVVLPGVKVPRRQTMEFGINYCADGLPPKSLL